MSDRDVPVTSEDLGSRMEVHPVVVRRTLAGLRDAGIVVAEKGRGGGWSIARDLAAVSLGDVHDAIGPKALFGIGVRDPHPRCPLERAVNQAVEGALREAEELFTDRLRSVSVADLLRTARPARPHGRKDRSCTTSSSSVGATRA